VPGVSVLLQTVAKIRAGAARADYLARVPITTQTPVTRFATIAKLRRVIGIAAGRTYFQAGEPDNEKRADIFEFGDFARLLNKNGRDGDKRNAGIYSKSSLLH
jgi:hypothetical protein